MPGEISANCFRAAMRRFAANVSLVTSVEEGAFSGLTATAVCSLSADPPSLLVCVNRNASAHAVISRSGAFAVNVLSGAHRGQAELFSSSNPADRQQRFRFGAWSTLQTGSPILDDAIVAFDCQLARQIEHATHSILIAEVVGIHFGPASDNLMYVQGGFSTLDNSCPAD